MDGYDDIAAQEAQQRSQAPVAPRDDTYDTMAAAEAEQRTKALKASLNVATQTNPDKAGKVQALADKSGLPAPVIERNEDYVAQQQKARDLYQAMQDSPVLARQMVDPSFAKIAQDDTPSLTTFEKIVQFPWKAMQSIASGLPALSGGLYGVAAAPFELSAQVSGQGPDSMAGRIGAFFRERSKGQASYAERVADTPKDAGLIQSAVSSGFQSLGQNLPTLITAMYMGNIAGALSIMSAATGGQSYTKARDKGLSPAQSTLYGATDAGFEYLTELLPVTKLIGDMKAGSPFIKTLMHNQVSEQLGEQAATVLQDFNEWATLHPEQPFSQYLSERPAAALQTAIATAIGSGGQVAILHAAANASGRDTIAEHGALDADALKQMLALAGGSKLRERSPSTFTQFVNEAATQGPVDAVYVNAAQFAQGALEAGIDIAKAMPETASVIQDAIATGSDVRIPLGEFAAAIPGTTLEQDIIQHLRTSPDGPTQAELGDKAWLEETKKQTEKILAEHDFNAQWKQSASSVETELLTQLQQTKRFTADVNKAYAGLMAAFYATQAQRLGITPEEMYVKYPLQIRAQNVAGVGTTIMGQGDLTEQHVQQFAEEIKAKHGIDTLDLHLEKSGDIKLDTIATTKTGTGVGSKAMQDVIDFADKHGRRITLSLAEKGYQPIENGPKTSSPDRLRAFYKRFGFVDNKGRNKDFTTHASMIRKPRVLEQPAYHGSPHNVDKFSTDFIGTGEGAQAYGWGLYFAENPSVAAGYFRQLSGTPGPRRIKLGTLTMSEATHWDYNPKGNSTYENIRSSLAETLLINESELYAGGVDGFQAHVLKVLDEKIDDYKTEWPEAVADAEKLRADLAKKGAVSIAFHKSTGGVYQVDIPDSAVAKMLLWDKSLSEQPENVKAALRRDGVDVDGKNDGDDFAGSTVQFAPMTGAEYYNRLADQRGGQRQASEWLAADGIPGIKYLDAGSRDAAYVVNLSTSKGPYSSNDFDSKEAAEQYAETKRAEGFTADVAENGTHNLVVFDDSIIKLTHKDGSPVTEQERTEFLQPAQTGARGNINFGKNIQQQPSIITLLGKADLSTFLHESGHFYLEVLTDMANQPDAPQEVRDDLNKTLAWFNVTPEQWARMTLEEKRVYHEQFARGFEAYLFEGKAPATELTSLFARFRAWMLNVYKQLKTLDVTLTAEVRGVMDRLLATNDEIIAAENARNMLPLFETKPDGMSEADWVDYQALGVEATQDAVDQLQTRSLRDMQWATNARSRALSALQKDAATKRKGVRAEVTAEVMREPLYAAEYGLRHGWVQDDGSKLMLKFNPAALAEMFPPTNPNSPDLSKLRGMTNADTGLHPDQVAELTGFGSGDELVRKLVDMEPRAQVIEGITDQRMLERFGDLADPASIAKAANEAVHNEARGRFVATELNALSKATGERKVLAAAAREYAEAIVARKKIRDIKPATYAAAETRAAKAAEKAIAKNDLVSAAAQKRNQLVNIYATRAAYGAVDEVEKAIAYLKRVGESKTIDFEYRDQINALLERFELRAITNKETARRSSLAQWIETQKEKGLEPVIDDELVSEANRKPYREMSLESFRGLVDAVRNIEHLGRLKHKLLTLQDQREFAAVVDQLVESIEANAKRTVAVKLERNTWLDKMKDGFTEFFAMHRKFAMMGRELDGHEDNGAFWNLLVKPMNAAGDNESLMREQATVKLQELFEPILKAGKLKEKTFIPAINGSLSREGRIMVALNTGNEGNLQRLMDGDHWTMPQVQAVVDTLTKAEMDFVQSIWNFVGSYRAQIGEQQKRLTGITPEWVEGRKVITQHGEYAGGYLPAKYDTTRSTRSLSDEAAAGIMDQWRAKRGIAKARDSFTKGRADKVMNRPLRKDFGVVFQHVTEVTHRLAWQDYLTDATRLLRASAIDNAIRDHYGPEALKALRDTIEDVAAGEVGAQNAFEKSVNYLRTGATIAGLGWRITTSLLQPIGLTQSMVRIGPKWVAQGMAEWIGDAAKFENTAKRIFDKSSMMRLRAKTMQREISEIRNQVNGKASAIEASYFYLIQKMQLVADIPTWLGQYHKAIAGGAAEDNAIAQADQAVLDAQGGGQIKDLAAIQRGGPMLKLFTNFYSFFNTTYNLTSDAVGRTNFRDPLSVGKLGVDMLLLYSVPAVLGTLLKAALHSGDDDAYKNLIRQLISDQLTYLFGTMVGLREFAGAVQTAAGLPGDYSGPASVRVFAEMAKLGKQAGQGEIDEALLKAADNVGGILLHYPAGQINATVDGIVTIAQGKTANPGALLVGSNKK